MLTLFFLSWPPEYFFYCWEIFQAQLQDKKRNAAAFLARHSLANEVFLEQRTLTHTTKGQVRKRLLEESVERSGGLKCQKFTSTLAQLSTSLQDAP
jgi:hypothetical protein